MSDAAVGAVLICCLAAVLFMAFGAFLVLMFLDRRRDQK